MSAATGSTKATRDLSVRPMGVSSIALDSTTVVGGHPVGGTVNLECQAGPGPVTVDLDSSRPMVASPVAASVVVPHEVKSETFTIVTTPVQSKQLVTISAVANEVEKKKSLSVISAAAVSTTTLAFGNQPTATTSGALPVVLSNKGAVAYSITGLSVTGTHPNQFVENNSCPAILAAGATCTIHVRFTPFSTGKKAAQLNIATSAKDVPLVVKMTGTGI